MICIGLDVHKRNTTVAWVDTETGELGESYAVPNEQVAEHLAQGPGKRRVVLEASSNAFFLARELKSCELEVTVVDAFKSHRLLEAMHTAKTDKLDAQTLAGLLAEGYLEGVKVWVPDDYTRQLRELTRAYQQTTQDSTRVRNRIRKFLGRQGLQCPFADLGGRGARQWLEQAVAGLSPPLQAVLQTWLAALADLVKQQEQLRTLIEAAVECDAQAQLLQTIPGVGRLLAAVLVAEIGALARFASRQKLRGYSGLVPRVRQSGERCWSGPLVKRGNPHLRWALVMTAGHFAASRQTRELTLMGGYRRQVYKHGPNPAKVALARRLLDIIFAMLRDHTVFDPARHAPREAA